MTQHHLHIDAHVHCYPCYDLPAFLLAASQNLPRLSPVDTRVLALAERADCHFFRSLAQDELPLPPDFRIVAYDPEGAVKLRHVPTHSDLWVLAGRQHNTAEKVEICSLFSDAPLPATLALPDLLAAIYDANAVPLLNFAPGKWLFKRGKLLAAAIRALPPEKPFLFADTSLRPIGWPTPALLRLAKTLRRPVLAGSDPLPFASEAAWPGAYCASLACPPPPDPSSLVPYLRSILLATPPPAFRLVGRRSAPLALFSRLRQNSSAKR